MTEDDDKIDELISRAASIVLDLKITVDKMKELREDKDKERKVADRIAGAVIGRILRREDSGEK